MPFWQSLIFFGVPTLLGVLCQYFLWPFFMGIGASEENAYYFQALVVFVSLLTASLVAYVVEGDSLDWSSFRHRCARALTHYPLTLPYPPLSTNKQTNTNKHESQILFLKRLGVRW